MTPQKGLYVPQLESDACGTGLIAHLKGQASHQLVEDALRILQAMDHRGATGYEENTGDGAGILIQTPHDFFVAKARELGFELPPFGKYGVGVVFFPADRSLRSQCRVLLNDYIDELGFELLGYRKVPTDNELLGDTAISAEPRIEQLFVRPVKDMDRRKLERRLFVLRKYASHRIYQTYPQTLDQFYIASLSYKTVVYKGQLTTSQLRPYFPDLHDDRLASAIALVHSRFSTNTVPKWKLAQPFRYIAHNGEINTIAGNLNWWKAREPLIEGGLFTKDELEKIWPVCGLELSDSGNFDNVLEFLVLSGRSLPHALMMMIPEAWQHDDDMPEHKKAFYEFHENLMQPWDGPAGICFTDGILVGAMLDRNGLRPLRYMLTDDDLLVVASEAGVLEVPPEKVVRKGRLQPGRILIADLDEGRIIEDEEVKDIVCRNKPYGEWLAKNKLTLDELPEGEPVTDTMDAQSLLRRQQLFGITREDLRMVIQPMAAQGKDPVGSMGVDWPLPVLSQQTQHLANYFQQLFAQVTNPPIDPIRERSVMSLHMLLGSSGDILEPDELHARILRLEHPVLTNQQLSSLRHLAHPHLRAGVVDMLFPADGQEGRLEAALDHICAAAEDFTRNGVNILILSDRRADARHAPVPSLLAVGAVHHHLVARGLRTRTSLVVEAGDVWETHHFATLIGYGANAVNPYLVYATLEKLWREGAFDRQPAA